MSYRTRLVLFVISILIPATVLVGLGVELYREQRQLILQRLAAERSQPIEELRQDEPLVRAKVESLFRESSLRFAFYAAAIVFALSVTLFCRYAVWRDVKRESHLAALRSQFVSNVSHELRTPLTSIRMFAETLSLGRVTDPARQRHYLETMARESQRLARLVDDVLAFSRLESGAARFRIERIALAAVVENALSALEQPLEKGGFRVHLTLPVEILETRADAEALEQAILNIVTNAMRYSGESRDIEVRVLRSGEEAVIEIADQGIGVPAEHRRRIFERYFRIPLPEHEAVSGVGIGLTVVDGIVKAHNGRVEVRDNTPHGSVFCLYLPLAVSS
jgi:signal transduction histidine kinase